MKTHYQKRLSVVKIKNEVVEGRQKLLLLELIIAIEELEQLIRKVKELKSKFSLKEEVQRRKLFASRNQTFCPEYVNRSFLFSSSCHSTVVELTRLLGSYSCKLDLISGEYKENYRLMKAAQQRVSRLIDFQRRERRKVCMMENCIDELELEEQMVCSVKMP